MAKILPSMEDIQGVAHMRMVDAAKVLGIKESKLRYMSRHAGFARWPGRKIKAKLNHFKVRILACSPC